MQLNCIYGLYIRMTPALSHTTSTVAPLISFAPSLAINWDAVGVMGSLVCLVHCLLPPLAVVVLPWLVLFEGESLHRWLAVSLAAPVLLAFVFGWRRHGRWLPGFFMAGGLATLNAAAFTAPEHWEIELTVLGGLFLIAAHVLNSQLCRRCPRCVDRGGCHS